MYKVIRFKGNIALFEDDKLIASDLEKILSFLNLSLEERIQFCADVMMYENCISDFGFNGKYILTKELGVA